MISEDEAKKIVEKMLPTIRNEMERTEKAVISMPMIQDAFPAIEREGINYQVYCAIARAASNMGLVVDIEETAEHDIVIIFRNPIDQFEIDLSHTISPENCKARWLMLQSGLFDMDEVNSLTNDAAVGLLENGPLILGIESGEMKRRGKVPFEEFLIERGVSPITKDNVVYAISRDRKYIDDIKELLFKNREDLPFGSTLLKYVPNIKPGFKGYYMLLVSNPSPELIRSIVPSPEGELLYSQLMKYNSEELANMIRDKFYKEGKSIDDIANELGVGDKDIRMWLLYYM